MSDPLSAPTLSDYLNAINAVKSGISTAIPAGYSLLFSSASDPTFAENGLSANAYVNYATGQIIIAYNGPVVVSANSSPYSVDPVLEAAATAIDLQIDSNDPTVTAFMQATADLFYSEVQNQAVAQGLLFSNSNVFVTGNSEGGLFAELTAKANTLAGATFGAPGIPGESANTVPQNLDFTNYINTSDPIGNLASDAYLSADIFAFQQLGVPGTQYHFGHTVFLGNNEAGTSLANTYQILVNSINSADGESGAGLIAAAQLGYDATLYHPFSSYAASLGVTVNVALPDPADTDFFVNVALLLANYSLLEGTVGAINGTGGASFQGAAASQFAHKEGFITSAQNQDGTFNNVLFQAPLVPNDPSPGTLAIAQTDLKETVVFLSKAWSNVSFVNGKFNVAFVDAASSQSATNGTLLLDAASGAVQVFGDDLSSFLLSNVTSLKVGNTEGGATQLSILDPDTGQTQGQVDISSDSANDNMTLASDVSGLTLSLGSGADTLLNLGSGSVINAGGTFNSETLQSTASYKLSVTNGTLTVGGSTGDSISLNGTGFVQTGGTLSSTPGTTALIVANGIDQTVAGGTGNNIVIAAGTSDTLNASQPGQQLIALGQSGDTLNGQTSSTSGLDRLTAVGGTVVGGNVSNVGNDILNAGIGNNIMIGDGVNTTFNIDTNQNPNAIDVVWATGGVDTLNVTGDATVYVVDAPDATLASVENLNVQALYQQLLSYVTVETWVWGASPIAPVQGPAIIAIDPTPNENLVVNGQQVTTGLGGPQVGGDLLSVTGLIENVAGPVVGLANGNFGITITNPNGVTPQVNLANYQVQTSSNASGGGRAEAPIRASSINRASPGSTSATRFCRSRRRQ
jgi:hypothetical protein